MRKSSSFGHRPPRGKPQVGGARVRSRPGGLTGKRPYGERSDRRDEDAHRGGAKMFRKRAAGQGGKPGGERSGRRYEDAHRGGVKMFRKRAAGQSGKPGGERSDRRDEDAHRGGAKMFRKRAAGQSGKPGGERSGRRDEDAHRGGAKMFRKRAADQGGKSGGERSDRRDEDAHRGGAKMFRKRAAGQGGKPGGERSDRRDEGAHRRGATTFRKRPTGGPGGKKPGVDRVVAAVAEPMRIAKAMARAGLCSRREAERWIADGRVSVNGHVLKTPAMEIKPRDRVLVDGQPLPVSEPTQLWRYHKAKGLVTTHNDPQGRPTLFDALPPGLPRVISIGRLDFNTEGLILLTNDGELARELELPSTGWLRRYRVRAKGRATQADLDRLRDGIEIEGVRYGAVEALVDTVQGANMWLSISIREGKNREVRKVLSSLGLEVNRLIRVAFGPFELSNLKPGEADPVPRKGFADQLGPDLASQFGLDPAPTGKGKLAKKGGRKEPRKGGAARPREGKPQRRREDD